MKLSTCGRRPNRLVSVAVAAGLAACVEAATAAPILFTRDLDFHASQSFWGPGRTSSDFNASGKLGSSVGVSYAARASSGNVTADYNGVLKFGLDPLDPRSVTIGFAGDPSGGSVDTFLGASLRADAFMKVKVPIWGTLHGSRNLLDLNYSLAIDTSFTPAIGQGVSGNSNELSLISPQFRIGVFVAGVDANVDQDLVFTPLAIQGNIVESLRGSSVTRTVPFVLNSSSVTVPLEFSQWGDWDLTLTDLRLDNLFSTGFDLSLDPFIRLDLPGRRFDATLLDIEGPSFDIYDTPRFSLAFGEVDNLLRTTVTVDEPAMASALLLSLVIVSVRTRGERSLLRTPVRSGAAPARR